ncbi:MAG: TonB-dependent receptor [Candidatus Marinimicrobia bacterium]|nr:TonB-dependent receptor [Candidatus Neomarinimicrobiota bacterium]
MNKSISFLFLLTLSNQLVAQTGIITGQITDAGNGEPLIGANVLIKGTSIGAASDIDGNYTILDVPVGAVTIQATYIGFEDQTQEVTLTIGETLVINIGLEREAIQMQTYVVTASRRRERVEDAPAAISVITQQEIRRESNTNLGDYLKQVKGVDFTQSGVDSYNLSARGFNSSFSSRLLTLTDGRMANIPSLRLIAYNVIPVSFEDVKQFEIVLGPSSALYGPNAHSGVLNIITSTPRESVGTTLNIQGGSLSQKNGYIRKLTFRHASVFKDFGFKVSAVAFDAYDWEHINDDEYEGHDPAFIGRNRLLHNGVDDVGLAPTNTAEFGNPVFTEEMLLELTAGEIPDNGIDDNGNGFIDENLSWVGLFYRDNIDEKFIAGTEAGSPVITQEMVDAAVNDSYNRYILDNGTILWGVTEDMIGRAYADGLDNNGDGRIDEGIDAGIDDLTEIWYDGFDNDGDGLVDEKDEIGSRWLSRFGSLKSGTFDEDTGEWSGFGFGDYIYDKDGNILFDTNNDGVYGGDDDFHLEYPSNFPRFEADANDDGIDDYPDFSVKNYRYDLRVDYDPNPDFKFIFSHGYAYARNINITGIARYLADGWVYKYWHGRLRYKNFFLQSYLNSSFSGPADRPTRNLATGGIISDRSAKWSTQFQHAMELLDGDFRFVWGIDYFLTMPDTRGTILSDNELWDRRDNNGNGEGYSPTSYADFNDNLLYDAGEPFNVWSSDSTDNVFGAISDGFDNDGDSDDYEDLNGNGIPDYVDSNGSGEFEYGETVEPGVRWLGDQRFLVYADGQDNDGDGKVDENIDEGIDESAEDNRYVVNELGFYYQLNWKINDKFELIQATRFDAHDRLTNMIEFNNSNRNYNPLNWKFNFKETDGLQVSPKIGLVWRPRDNQNIRLTYARAFNTPSNQALFLDIFVTRVVTFKVYARGAHGGYIFPRDTTGSPDEENPDYNRLYDQIYWKDPYDAFALNVYNPETHLFFYPSADPKIEGYFKSEVLDRGGIFPEVVQTLELGYKGRITPKLYGTLDIFGSHFNSFVSSITFITPIVVEKEALTKDWNKDGVINEDPNNIIDDDDLETSFDHWRDFLVGVAALDTTRGQNPPIVVGYVNYGEVNMGGMDMSLTWFFNREWTFGMNYSYLSITEFHNPITDAPEPINAPKHKGGIKIQYNPRKFDFNGSLKVRYVDTFPWSSGIYFGTIKAYIIGDLHTSYKINDHLSAMMSVNNILDFRHIEIMGGPSLGRSIIFRLQAKL